MCTVTDSLQLARKMYPGKRNNLDALCDRLGIDNSKRVLHGALLDAEILADVFLMMTGGQIALIGEDEHEQVKTSSAEQVYQPLNIDTSNLIVLAPDEEELAEHLKYLELINKKSKGNCLWTRELATENTTVN